MRFTVIDPSPSPLLTRTSRYLLGAAILTFVAGAGIAIYQAPCSTIAPYVLLSSIVVAVLAAITFLIRAFVVRSGSAWRGFGVAVLVALGVCFFSFYVSIMLCRGV